jgi:alpha-D-glucose phosphate-specific phosphoglucomutase
MIKFGTDGWRSIIARDFTFANLSLVTQAISEYLKKSSNKNGIFIGYDNRFLSEEFALDSGKTLAAMGHRVFISKKSIPTPVTAFMIRNMDMSGGIMITASHNPPQYNGIKFIPYYGGPADSDITDEIENYLSQILKGKIKAINPGDKGVNIKSNNIKYISEFDGYINNLLSLFDTSLIMESGIKISADMMYGAAINIFPSILKDYLKLDTVILNNKRDALFGGRLPDPSENNLKDLKQSIIDNGSDIGIALDGDGDRFGVIDGRGIFLSPNNVLSICLYYLLNVKKIDSEDFVVRTVATTHLLDAICLDKGIKIIEKPVGFKYIGKEMLGGRIIIGGEESGGMSIKGHIPEKDGLLANIMLLEIQAYLMKKYKNYYLSDFLNKIYSKFGKFYNIRLDIKIPENKKNEVIGFFSRITGDKIINRVAVELVEIDGTKIIFDDGSWFLVRPSGTEPLIRCYIESTDKDYFEALKSYIIKTINKICD